MAEDFSSQRKRLVEEMKRGSAVKSESVEKAFLAVKRELFFSEESNHYAYADAAFPIGLGQTISQPSTIAAMLEALDANPGQSVLEIGSGSGYVLALLSELVGGKGSVFAIELLRELHQKAAKTVALLTYRNIFMKCGDGTLGWEEKAPFDRILVSAACEEIPKPLAEQLREGGKIVAPLGNKFTQELVCMQKQKSALKEISRQG